jgi:prolyl oligopeptidase
MHKIILVALGILLSYESFSQKNEAPVRMVQSGGIQYPKAYKSDQVDNYFGTLVQDPYRYFEQISSKQIQGWIEDEKTLTEKYFSKYKILFNIRERIKERFYYESNLLSKEGKYFFYFSYDGAGESPSLYIKNKINKQGSLLIKPSDYERNINQKARIVTFEVSKDNKYIAFALSESGSDWKEIRVVNIQSGKAFPEVIKNVKISTIAWRGNGFYYGKFDEPSKGNELTEQNRNSRIYYHLIGTPQEQDLLIYEQPSIPLALFNVEVTSDERFLIIYGGQKNEGKLYSYVYVKDFNHPDEELKPFIINEHITGYTFSVIDNVNDKLVVFTNINAPKGKVLLYNPAKLNDSVSLIPPQEAILQDVVMIHHQLIGTYLRDMKQSSVIFDSSGNVLQLISYPPGTSAGEFSGNNNDSVTLFYQYSYTSPAVACEYNMNTYQLRYLEKLNSTKQDQLESTQLFFSSKDGTIVPMTLIYKKGIKKDGNNPTILYGYGGYGVPITPFFDPGYVFWIENGGILAVPGIRGGGEYGEAWHKAGRKLNKQNAFDDFISAAEFLIKEKYTSSEKLAMRGSSNGGLMIGAVMNQRPELFKVAIAEVGVFDMLRYQDFTLGFASASEFGTSEDSTEFEYLYKYSPLHNVKNNAYPATFIITADHDDRVPPFHSYKFAAALQEKNTGTNPILLRIQTNSGHFGGQTLDKVLDNEAYIYTFIMENMNVKLNLRKTK